jgi:ubiquinone/menaquinone biosynthesis C-methylase UbiE
MFNNNLIRKLCTNSNEAGFQLSQEDWNKVLNANSAYEEDYDPYVEIYKSKKEIGRNLLHKIGLKELDLSDSLELCCGSGYLYFVLKGVAKYGSTSYFIDISQTQCEQFKQGIGDKFLKKNIIVGDISKLDFADESLEIVYGNSFLHHLPDVTFYVKEFKRVLKKNGRLILFHEPNTTASFFQSFPISLYKDTTTDSLTDVWVFPAQKLKETLEELNFEVALYPTGILSSLLLHPFFIIFDKINKQWRHKPAFTSLRYFLDRADKILPMKLRLRYSPSIAYVCKNKI